MGVSLYDTMRRGKAVVEQPAGRALGIYCCGPTVYGPAHIGNFRAFVVQDVLRRTLEVAGLKLRHVRNVTDVDDKTIRRSQEEGKSLTEFTEFWTAKFHADCVALNLLQPDDEPKATEHIAQQVGMIQALLDKGHAYVGGDGSVYFKVATCEGYGQLANLDPEQLQTQDVNSAGDVNDADEYDREQVRDFALWKAWKEADGPNAWDSPWGRGRPGWHIECSAMSTEYLGAELDIHGGGIDLCFPHHTNEIAQSECATGHRPYVRHWFHNAHLMVEGQKMSKSLGNLYTLDDLTAKGYSVMEIRYTLISGHYRQQLNFTENGLKAARSALAKLEKAIGGLLEQFGIEGEEFRARIKPSPLIETGVFQHAWAKLCDDLNVPAALGELFTALKNLEADPDFSKVAVRGQLEGLGALLYALGLKLFAADRAPEVQVPAEIQELAQQRWDAKQAKDWAAADALRDELTAKGWTILDRKDGFEVEPA